MNIVKRTNQKNLGFNKSMELRVNPKSNVTTLSSMFTKELNIQDNQTLGLTKENGQVYLVLCNDTDGFKVKDSQISTQQFGRELLEMTERIEDNVYIHYTIGNQVMLEGYNCWSLTFVRTSDLRKSTENVQSTIHI